VPLQILRPTTLTRHRLALAQLFDQLFHSSSVATERLGCRVDVRGKDVHLSYFSIQNSALSLSSYQPQQSVLKRHTGQRQTACMRNISAPHRSHRTLSFPVNGQGGGVADGLERSG
jgi:hypothetical protein